MIVASGEINLQSKHDPICRVEKVKATTSAHFMADVKAETHYATSRCDTSPRLH